MRLRGLTLKWPAGWADVVSMNEEDPKPQRHEFEQRPFAEPHPEEKKFRDPIRKQIEEEIADEPDSD